MDFSIIILKLLFPIGNARVCLLSSCLTRIILLIVNWIGGVAVALSALIGILGIVVSMLFLLIGIVAVKLLLELVVILVLIVHIGL